MTRNAWIETLITIAVGLSMAALSLMLLPESAKLCGHGGLMVIERNGQRGVVCNDCGKSWGQHGPSIVGVDKPPPTSAAEAN